MRRFLIVTADDLGMCEDVDRACLASVDEGWASGLEIMPPAPSFAAAARAARERRGVDIGVHLTLLSEFETHRWRPLLPRERVPSLYAADGTCHRDVDELRRHARDAEVCAELDAQIEAVLAAGLEPSHLTQHMFALDEAAPASSEIWGWLADVCRRRSWSVRVTSASAAARLRASGVIVVERVLAEAHEVPAEDKLDVYARLIRASPAGVTELVMHPGVDGHALRQVTRSADRRQRDLELLTGQDLREIVRGEGIDIIRYRDLPRLEPSRSTTA